VLQGLLVHLILYGASEFTVHPAVKVLRREGERERERERESKERSDEQVLLVT